MFFYQRITLFLCILVWIFASVWSGFTVATGLITAKNFSSYPEWTIYVFAGFLQTTVSLCALYLPPLFSNKKWIGLTVCLAILVFLQSGELFHQIIAQIKNSQGVGLVQVNKSRIKSIDSTVTSQASNISSFVQSLHTSYDQAAANARRGNDESGVSKCGDICKNALERRDLVSKYVAFFNTAIPSSATGDYVIRELYDQVDSRLMLLEARAKGLNDMVVEVNSHITKTGRGEKISMNQAINANVATLRSQLTAFASGLEGLGEGKDVDLAMQQAFSVLENFMTGKFSAINPKSWLAIFYGIASLTAIIAMSILIRFITNVYIHQEVEHLEKEVERERKVGGLYQQLRDAKITRSIHEGFSDAFNSIRKFKKTPLHSVKN